MRAIWIIMGVGIFLVGLEIKDFQFYKPPRRYPKSKIENYQPCVNSRNSAASSFSSASFWECKKK